MCVRACERALAFAGYQAADQQAARSLLLAHSRHLRRTRAPDWRRAAACSAGRLKHNKTTPMERFLLLLAFSFPLFAPASCLALRAGPHFCFWCFGDHHHHHHHPHDGCSKSTGGYRLILLCELLLLGQLKLASRCAEIRSIVMQSQPVSRPASERSGAETRARAFSRRADMSRSRRAVQPARSWARSSSRNPSKLLHSIAHA